MGWKGAVARGPAANSIMEYTVAANPSLGEPTPMPSARRRSTAVLAVLLLASCTAERRDADAAAGTSAAADPSACFGSRMLSYQSLMAEVVIPPGESCGEGTFTVVFTRGADTVGRIDETRTGVVGFIGTADVNGDGRGEFFVATEVAGTKARGQLHAYTDTGNGIERLPLAALDSAQLEGYDGGDRFGFGGANQLVRAFPLPSGDSAWYGYSHGESKWVRIDRPSWLR